MEAGITAVITYNISRTLGFLFIEVLFREDRICSLCIPPPLDGRNEPVIRLEVCIQLNSPVEIEFPLVLSPLFVANSDGENATVDISNRGIGDRLRYPNELRYYLTSQVNDLGSTPPIIRIAALVLESIVRLCISVITVIRILCTRCAQWAVQPAVCAAA